jgi:parvulin-like peptidyl-prolyl isomerase
VDGHGISHADVESELRRGGGTPRGALDRLVERELLAAEATRRGFGAGRDIERGAKRAAVRGLLHAVVEEHITEASIEPDAIREAYERSHDRFHAAERRRVEHILVRIPEDADDASDALAAALAAEHLAELRSSSDPAAVLARVRSEPPPDGYSVSVEDLGVFGRSVGFVPPFRDAVFAVSSPGVLGRPLRTQFGWHAIWVREVWPPTAVSFAEAAPLLRREIVVMRRRAALESLERELREDGAIELDEARVRALLARDPLEPRAGT